jgi:uncharacterized protein YndB with AHSA1/START domain
MIKRKKTDLLQGILYSNIFALISIYLTEYVEKISTGESGVLVLSAFVLIPLVIGIINTFFWRIHNVSTGQSFAYGFYNLIISILLSVFVLREGTICLIIVSPLIYIFIMVGIFLGRFMFKAKKNKLNMSLIAAILSIFVINLITANPSNNLVIDEVLINASPQEVWKNVVSFPPIVAGSDYWLFRIGLPSPVQSTAEGDFLGARRECIFSNGAIFEEKIVELEPNKKLTFDITKQPDDPEIIGHINLLRGQFILQDNKDGTTTLIGKSWYELKIKPSQYFDIWTKSIVRNVHLRVMEHIKQLSEST